MKMKKLSRSILLTVLTFLWIYYEASLAQSVEEYEQYSELLDEGQYRVVIDNLEPLLDTSPNDARLHYLLGKALIESVDDVSLLRKLSHARRGRKSLETAIRLQPTMVEARKELADYYFYAPAIGGGSKSKSAEILAEIKEIDEFSYYLYQGGYQLNEGDWQGAKEAYLEAQKLKPELSAPLLQLGIVNRRLQLYQESQQALDRAFEINPEETMALFHLGLLGLSEDSFFEASINGFERYIDIVGKAGGPYLDQAHYRMGQLWQRQGNSRNAAEYYRRAIELNSEYDAAREALESL